MKNAKRIVEENKALQCLSIHVRINYRQRCAVCSLSDERTKRERDENGGSNLPAYRWVYCLSIIKDYLLSHAENGPLFPNRCCKK